MRNTIRFIPKMTAVAIIPAASPPANGSSSARFSTIHAAAAPNRIADDPTTARIKIVACEKLEVLVTCFAALKAPASGKKPSTPAMTH